MRKFSLVKKLFILFLLPVMVAALSMPGLSAYAATGSEPLLLNPIDGKIIQKIGPPSLPDISIEARAKGIQPASLKNITLRLKPGVDWLSEDQVQIIKEHAASGKINQSLLPSVEPGKIYVDPSSLLAFEFVRGEGGVLYVLLADEDKIVEEISIPEQTVFLNEANITRLTQGINVTSYKMKSGNTERAGFNFYFDERQTLPGYDQDGKRIEVALKGSLNVDSPAVEVKYTKDNGYKLIFFASQNAEVQAELLAELKKDVKIPLYDFTIPAEGCKITVGFFLVLGVDGRITLEYSVTQSSSIRAGLQGDTAYYLPTSIEAVKEVSFAFTPENLSLSADVKGETSLLAEVAFDILGKGKVILDNKLGVLLEAKAGVQGTSGDYLSIKGDGFVKINGKVKVKSFDKSKTIYEYKYPLFNYVKERSSDYNIEIAEACAYRDIIKGSIVEKVTGKPYAGQEIQLKVISSSGSEKVLNAVTDKSGSFSRAYDLKKGDRVSLKIPGSANAWSYPREASFPFNHVIVEVADYLTNTAKGYVSSSEQGTLAYNGPISLYIERSNTIPLHHEEDISLPVEYAIKLQVQSIGGTFQLQGVDLRPFDKVYAVLEREGFVIASNKLETDGITVSVAGGYMQEAHRLSSQGSYVLLGYPRSAPPFTGEAYLQVSSIYLHSASPEDTLKSKEWNLNLAPVPGGGKSVAGTGPWELDLNNLLSLITSNLDRYRLQSPLGGGRSINYHVFETVRFYVEGKKLEYFNEAKTCEEERSSNLLSRIEKIIGTDHDFPPFIGSIPAGYYLNGLRAIVLNLGEQTSTLRPPPLSPQNCAADVTINYYRSSENSTILPYYSRSIKFSALREQQKVETGIRDPILLWDKNSKTKVVQYQEFPRKESVRYDLEDYIPELQNVPFVLKGTEQVNGVSCQIWEKSRKIDPIMNVYVKVQLYIALSSNLPLKVVFYDGYYQKIELSFSNWRQASRSGTELFSPPFGKIKMPSIQLELPSTCDESEQAGEGNQGQVQEDSMPGTEDEETEQSNEGNQDQMPENSMPSIENEEAEQLEEGKQAENNTDNMQDTKKSSSVSISLSIGDPFMIINGNKLEIDPGRGTMPLIMGSRTILPIRAVVEALEGSIRWNENERKITINRQNTAIEMWVGKKEMLVNGEEIRNDVPPVIIEGRTYVPVRFVAENLNCDVNWDEATRTVIITTK
ncbi:MAG: copper amine oxidase N-terminal domain-containing protein [Firmicutes bacterium]|nr:copper amine oxidase N-terminal domain-containing protein [Bacillota bacterium]